MDPIFYDGHKERYPHLSEDERMERPDEVRVPGRPPIKRIKNFSEMTEEDWDRYGPTFIRLAAKDIPLSRAEIYH